MKIKTLAGHTDNIKHLRNEWEVEKSGMRRTMQEMREELLSQQAQIDTLKYEKNELQ